jgi:hypothetical protein
MSLVFVVGAPANDVIISEFLASSSGGYPDEDGDSVDWIEVYNGHDSAVNLAGWYLTDSGDDLQKWAFPTRTLGAGGFVIVFASGKDRDPTNGELHANFSLSSGGEYLALVRPDGSIASEFNLFPEQRQDVSYGAVMEATTTRLVSPGATARVRIPTDDRSGSFWTGGNEPFDDFAWNDGDGSTTGVGFASVGEGGGDPQLLAGLVAVYNFETSNDVAVTDGQAATGRVDEVGGHAQGPFHGNGDGGRYRADVPAALTSSRFSYEVDESGGIESFDVVLDDAISDLTTGDFTLHTWFKTTDTGRSIFMGSCCTGANSRLNFELHTDNRLRVWINGPSATTDLNVSVSGIGNSRDGQWHSAAAVRRGGNVELYYEGELVGERSDVAGLFEQSPAFYYFGRDDRTGSTRFDGNLDDIAMWNRALGPDEIESLAAGATLQGGANFADAINTDVRDEMQGDNASAYVRIPFDVPDPDAYQSLRLLMKYDDGYVVYINGTEVARRNAPGGLTWNSSASSESSALSAWVYEDTLLPSAETLEPGRNVLAIHGLNVNTGDDDFLVLPELLATTSGIDPSNRRYFLQPTPGEVNTGGVVDFLDEVEFSVTRGFFDASFSVALSHSDPDASIKFTLDGSWPTESHGLEYVGPIDISTTTTLRATAVLEDHFKSYTTHTYLFLGDVIRQPTLPAGFPSVWQPGYTADYAMDARVVDNPRYRETIEDDLRSIPTMSIVMDMDDVFNQPNGIYSNSQQRGVRWERVASTEFFDPSDPTREFHVNSAIRSHGGATRNPDGSIKHSFRLIFKDTFGPDDEPTYGPTKLRFPLFEDSPVDRFDTLVLRGGYNYSYLHGSSSQNRRAQYMRERWMRETQRDTGHLSSHGSYVHLYVNGLYWGIFSPQERPDVSFMAQHLGGDREDYETLNANTPSGGDWVTTAGWTELVRRADNNLAITQNYDAVLDLLDVDNLIDYMIVHVYGGTTDWPVGPTGKNYWQGRSLDDEKWQFFIWDGEYSLQGVNDNRVNVRDANTPPFIYYQLRANPEYRILFADHVHRHFFNDGALTPGQNIARYLDLADFIERAMVGESARWGDRRRPARPYTLAEWYTERNWMTNTYMSQRTNTVLGQFRSVGLYPAVTAPTFNQHGGSIPDGFNLEINAPAGITYYTLDGTDPRLPGGAISPDARVASEGAASLTLLASEADVRVLVPTNGTLGLSWTAIDFDDGGWIAGQTGVGYERGTGYEELIGTDVEAQMDGINASVYLRIEFDVEDPANLHFLNLLMKYDDGYVAYLNGERVAARNAPGDLQWNSDATTSHLDSDARVFEAFDLTDRIELLRFGRNVLAIHGLNTTDSSSDMLILPEIRASDSDSGVGIRRTTRALARARVGSDWSALNEAVFVVDSSVLRITEIMFHPPEAPEGSPFRNRDDFEFIEFQNIGDRPLNLMDIRFAAGVDFTFRETRPENDLEPGDFVLIVKDIEAFATRYDIEGLYIAGEYKGNLSNGGDFVVLVDSLGRPMVDFVYSDRWYPLADGLGSSLEVVDPTALPEVWRTRAGWQASEVEGGTPGSGRDQGPPANQIPGDLNQDSVFDVSDAVSILRFLFLGSPAGLPCDGTVNDEGNRALLNVNGDAAVDLTDGVSALLYLFQGGSPHVLGTRCVFLPGCPDACE